jgi:hypothetical protein
MRSKTPAQLLSFTLHTFYFPKVSPPLKHISNRKTSGCCLGTFKPGVEKNNLAPPLNVVSLTTSPTFSFSLSLSLDEFRPSNWPHQFMELTT